MKIIVVIQEKLVLIYSIAEDEDNSSYTRKVSVNLLLKLRE